MIRKPSQPKSGSHAHTIKGGRRPGTLFVVGTPIGCPEDLSLRAVHIFQRVAFLAAETPRATQLLLTHHNIQATITSYGPHNCHEKVAVLLHRLREGHDVALVSDNGMPVIYDPGRSLIAAAHKAGLPVTVIPGPSVLTTAVALSGYSGDSIVFEGRLPKTKRSFLRFISWFKGDPRTTVFFVQPDFLSTVMEVLAQTLPTRNVTLAIDLTGPEEALLQGRPGRLLTEISSLRQDAKITLVLEGGKKQKRKGH